MDLDNSPDVPLCKPIVEELARHKYDVVLTGQNCFQVPELVKKFNMKGRFIGRHLARYRPKDIVLTLILPCYYSPRLPHSRNSDKR
jgi:predicted glycosyltransferase